MLNIKKLKFCNIGRFIDPQEIDFGKLDSLTQIDALNISTGGSSGSGKSTILNAIDFVFGLNDLPISTIQSRLTKSHVTVTIELDWEGKHTVITRAKKLSIIVDGEETSGASSITEAKLDGIIGMDRKLFRLLIHKRQGENGFFLHMTPAKINDFLTDALNLASVRNKLKTVDLKIKDLVSAKSQAQASLDAAKSALEATQEAFKTIGIEPTSNVTEETIKLLETALNLSKSSLELRKEEHFLEKAALEAKRPKTEVLAYDKALLNSLDGSINAVEAQIRALSESEAKRQNEINRQISNLKLNFNSHISFLKLEHNKKVSDLKTSLIQLEGVIQVGKTSRESAIKLATQINTLRGGTCQTCLQSWVTEEAKNEEKRLLQELGQHKSKIEAAAKAGVESEKVKEELASLEEAFSLSNTELTQKHEQELSSLAQQAKPRDLTEDTKDLRSQLENLKAQKAQEQQNEIQHNITQNAINKKTNDVYFAEMSLLSSMHQKELEDLNLDVTQKRRDYERFSADLKHYKDSYARYHTTLTALNKRKEEYDQKVVQMNQKLADVTEELEIAEEAERCIKSYLSCSFDNALDTISDSATRILRSVPTMANATLRLEGLKEANNGTIKEQVTPFLDNDGEIGIPLNSLSGGERAAVDFATDLAVCFFVQDVANKGMDLMGLDEVFGGFDAAGIESALEMIKTVVSDKKVLIIEHNGIAKEFVQSRLTVVREGETSRIENNA